MQGNELPEFGIKEKSKIKSRARLSKPATQVVSIMLRGENRWDLRRGAMVREEKRWISIVMGYSSPNSLLLLEQEFTEVCLGTATDS